MFIFLVLQKNINQWQNGSSGPKRQSTGLYGRIVGIFIYANNKGWTFIGIFFMRKTRNRDRKALSQLVLYFVAMTEAKYTTMISNNWQRFMNAYYLDREEFSLLGIASFGRFIYTFCNVTMIWNGMMFFGHREDWKDCIMLRVMRLEEVNANLVCECDSKSEKKWG